MHLSKYPVYGERGEYRVDVYIESHGTWGDYLCADVYLPTGRRWRKWKRVWEKHGVTVQYWSQWDGRYVELAKTAVAEYEYHLHTNETEDRIHNRGIEQFEQWDGR